MKINKARTEIVFTKHILQNFEMAPKGLFSLEALKFACDLGIKLSKRVHSVSLLIDSFHSPLVHITEGSLVLGKWCVFHHCSRSVYIS